MGPVPDPRELERRVLRRSVAGCLVVAVVGVGAAIVTGSGAILLDGLFNAAYLVTGLFTLRVAELLRRGDDRRYPAGYAAYEPLVNGLKGALILGVSVAALADALTAIVAGGREIAAGFAVAYGAFASAVGWGLAITLARDARTARSPLAEADAKNWLVNAAVSSCVVLAFAIIFLIRGTRLDGLVPFVDPLVIVALVLASIGVPIRLLWTSSMQLLNRAPDDSVTGPVRATVEGCVEPLGAKELFVRVLQPGRTRFVTAHVVLDPDRAGVSLRDLDGARERAAAALNEAHAPTVVDLVFTADRRWGAPVSEGGQGRV